MRQFQRLSEKDGETCYLKCVTSENVVNYDFETDTSTLV